jgi:Fe-S-cluster containining protein
MSDFPCTQCALCCKNVGVYLKNRDLFTDKTMRALIDAFPYAVDESGCCEMLEDNKCTVYEGRPYLCNVDAAGEMFGIERDLWYRLNADACNALIRLKGLDDSFLIKDYDQ